MAEVTWSFPTIRPRMFSSSAPQAKPASEPPVHIESYGYTLRSLRRSDTSPELLAILNSKELQAGLNIEPLQFTEKSLSEFISRFDDRHNYFVGIFKNHQIKGFYTIDVNLIHRAGMITAGLSESASREGRIYWATIEAFIDHLFVYRNIDKVSARILSENRAMLFNFMGSKIFSFEGTLRQECRGLDGTRQDVMVFSAIKGESNPDGLDYIP